MDVLLIYPPITMGERYGKKSFGRIGGHLPPLGLAYLAAVLRDAGFTVGVIDGPACNLDTQSIIKNIARMNPKVIGLSVITPLFYRAQNIVDKIRESFPDTLVLIGGHHASILPREVLVENSSFDIAVYGEGERTVLELMQQYKKHDFVRDEFLSDFRMLSSIKGIAFRRQGQIAVNPGRPLISDLDELPYPAWDLLPMNRYLPLPNQYLNKPVIHMIAIRGCPFQCTFCSTHAVFGHTLHALSPARLIELIEHVKGRFGAREISFWDDSITINKKWLLDFCELLLRRKVNVTWTCYSRVDTVDREMLTLMKKSGCWNIFYGYESGNQELLDMIGKNITLERIREVNRWTKEAGIEVRASFMLAIPGETPEMAEKTARFAIALEPDYAQFTVTTPHPGTELFRSAQKFGSLSTDLSKYNHWEPIFVPHGYKNKEEVERIQKMVFRKFYLRTKYILGRIRKIRSPSDVLRYIKGLSMVTRFLY